MFSYFKNKVLRVDDSSPVKKNTHLQNHEQIYLEQISNYIEIEGGYQLLKKKLFKEIISNYCYDSPFIQELVILLQGKLTSLDPSKVNRSLDVIEDLISNCGKVLDEAFNKKQFCDRLEGVASINQYTGLVMKEFAVMRNRAAGIILYLSQKYENEQPHYIFGQYLKRLSEKKIEVPRETSIKESEILVQEKASVQTNAQHLPEILKNTEEFVVQAENKNKNFPAKIDTLFVRSIKAKNKILYDLATSASDISEGDKSQISALYKRLRALLKEIQKKNSSHVSQKAIDQERQYLEKKVSGINKKKPEPSTQKQEKSPDLLGEEHPEVEKEEEKGEEKQGEEKQGEEKQGEEKQGEEKQGQEKEIEKQKMKINDEVTDLLDMGNSETEKKDLMQLYKNSNLSKEMEGLNLLDSKDEEFGEFQGA